MLWHSKLSRLDQLITALKQNASITIQQDKGRVLKPAILQIEFQMTSKAVSLQQQEQVPHKFFQHILLNILVYFELQVMINNMTSSIAHNVAR